MNHSQRNSAKTQRRNVNRKKQQPTSHTSSKSVANTSRSSDKSDDDEPVEEMNEAETTMENGDDEGADQTMVKTKDEQRSHVDSSSSMKDDSTVPSKPQANVAPVKSMSYSNSYSKTFKNHSDYQSRHNGYPSSSYNQYSYSNHLNSLPPRFRQQYEQREAAMNNGHQQYRRRRGRPNNYRPFYSSHSPGESNGFRTSSSTRYEPEFEPNDIDDPNDYPEEQTPQPVTHPTSPSTSMMDDRSAAVPAPPPLPPPPPPPPPPQNDYSSESELLSDTPSTNATNSLSPSVSTSHGSHSPLRGLELLRTLSNSNGLFNDLVALFDNVPFSTSELELLISKIATKHILNKQEVNRLLSSTKDDKAVERILDETYLSQVKILAIELQAEKNRVQELTKSNSDLDQTIRQLQQQQQQQGGPNYAQYHQMIVSYQIQLRQLAEENARLRHQLSAYMMMPTTLNELKQQNQTLTEQLRQLTVRNSALENEAKESEQASKHAAEIYKKADSQKQERIEQMISDINKYKKLDKELTALKQKYSESEKSLDAKLAEATAERDQLRSKCENLEDQVKNYEALQNKYEQLSRTSSIVGKKQLEQELNQLKAKNDQLRQENWKGVEKINELSGEKKK